MQGINNYSSVLVPDVSNLNMNEDVINIKETETIQKVVSNNEDNLKDDSDTSQSEYNYNIIKEENDTNQSLFSHNTITSTISIFDLMKPFKSPAALNQIWYYYNGKNDRKLN